MDLGSGAGFDCFVAGGRVGATGRVIGVDMTEEMLAKSRKTAQTMGLGNVEFREGILEELPVEVDWADVVMSNGVINLCADKKRVFDEIQRVLKPGGYLQFADIANGKPVPGSAVAKIEVPVVPAWQKMLEDSGFVDVRIGPPIDTFGGAKGEPNARKFEVFGYAFIGRKPLR